MRPYARLRAGRIVAIGLRVWLRRCLQIHAVAAVCLAPLFVVPELRLGRSRDAFADGQLVGIFGIYPSAWVVASDDFPSGLARNVALAYLGQFALTVLLVRDAHRQLALRAPRCRVKGLLALPLLAAGGLVVFAGLDRLAMEFSSDLGLWFPLAVAVTVAEVFLAGACWLMIPAAAVDDRGVFSAIGRSPLLSRGSRSAVASIAVMLVALQGLIFIPIGLLAGAAGIDFPDLPPYVVAIPIAIFVTLKACILAAAYHEACYRKEGAGAEEISAVFA